VSTGSDQDAVTRDFAEIWRAADKIVYSRTLQTPSTDRTRVEHEFDPAVIRGLKASSGRDLSIGGAEIAGEAFAAGLVDECRLFLHPILVGGGKPALPNDLFVRLELLDEHRFPSGVVYLDYGVRG